MSGFNLLKAGDMVDIPEKDWLIDDLWGRNDVGIIGGEPKVCKSWLALELAVSVASGRLCLGRYAVKKSGLCLAYFAEDSLQSIGGRFRNICYAKKIAPEKVPVFFIDSPVLRLDDEEHRAKLEATIAKKSPTILILDPLVRLHSLDENNAGEMSILLSFLRQLQRSYGLSIVLTHHSGKRRRERGGLSLRGSSDLHAFGDTNIYLTREKEQIYMELEHRKAPSPEQKICMELNQKPYPHLHLLDTTMASPNTQPPEIPLQSRIMDFLSANQEPQTGTAIREQLSIRNATLVEQLKLLEADGLITKLSRGWIRS
jgi:hypothetical protein